MVASIGDARVFKNGRQLAAWLGLTPRQHSSGGKVSLGKMSKRGDRYLRTLLVHGSRTLLYYCSRKSDPKSIWAARVMQRRHVNVAAVALAAKQARTIWAMLAKGGESRPIMT
jgi:transposase